MPFSNTLLSSFLILVLILDLANKVVSQGDTTSFDYDSFNSSSPSLIFQGDAFIPSSSSFVRLTRVTPAGQPAEWSIGRLVYSPPVKFWEVGFQASFVTTIRFIITESRSHRNPPGDGLTFFIVPVNSTIPPGSYHGNFGLFDPQTGFTPSVFAVEFDSAINPWDPSQPHIGIDINSRVSTNTLPFPVVGQEVTAHIHYSSSLRTITVNARIGSQISTLTYHIDLKTILPREVQVGISAATGTYVSFHDLRAWTFTSVLVPERNETYIQQYV